MTALPHQFKRIRLTSRAQGVPGGSAAHGYEFVAPLAADGHIDVAAWREHRANCRVRRFWGDEE